VIFLSFPSIVFSMLLFFSGGAFAFSEVDELEAKLVTQRASIEKDRKELNAECGAVRAADATKITLCKQRHDNVAQRINKYKNDHRHLEIIKEAIAGKRDFFYGISDDNIRIPVGIKLLAMKLKWDAEKLARLDKALNELGFDGLEEITEENVRDGWRTIEESADNADLMRAAATIGPRLSTVGQRTKMDCAVSAIATASGMPYDDVAARAKELIAQGKWRHEVFREDPQEALNKGLTGGEVVLLAESLGRTEVVPSSRFEEVLKSGRPVMVNVATVSSKYGIFPGTVTMLGSHQVILTRTFQNNGKTWYEMADPVYPETRYFVTPEKLNLILQEKGVAFGQGS
jgi:hypothetical protein